MSQFLKMSEKMSEKDEKWTRAFFARDYINKEQNACAIDLVFQKLDA